MSVALDTMVLIWGLQKSNPSNRGVDPQLRDLQRRSRILIRDLEEKKERIIIPTVAVAELLVPIPAADRGGFVAALSERFFCPPLDLRAAALAAELFHYHRQGKKDEQIDRRTLKSDVLIIATAKAAGASSFYSHDLKCRKLADQAGLTSRDLPTHSQNLFTNVEASEDEDENS